MNIFEALMTLRPGELHGSRLERPAWHEQAACRGESWLMFDDDPASILAAKELCVTCLVSAECLSEALAGPVAWDLGVRGGLSEAQRRTMRRRQ